MSSWCHHEVIMTKRLRLWPLYKKIECSRAEWHLELLVGAKNLIIWYHMLKHEKSCENALAINLNLASRWQTFSHYSTNYFGWRQTLFEGNQPYGRWWAGEWRYKYLSLLQTLVTMCRLSHHVLTHINRQCKILFLTVQTILGSDWLMK